MRSAFREAPVTMVLAALMALSWLAALFSGQLAAVAEIAGLIPARLGGAAVGPGLVPAWLTPISAGFVHADALHLGFNLLTFAFCGRQVEPAIGGRLMALLLLIGAYAAALAEWLANPVPTQIIIGASGAISALIAVYALLFNEQQVRSFGPIPPWVVRIVWLGAAWIGLQAMIGLAFGGQIAWLSHVGGFVAGLLVARPLLRWRFRHRAMAHADDY